MKRLFHRATIGIAIGVIIGFIFSSILLAQLSSCHRYQPWDTSIFNILNELQIMLISVVIWALIGVSFSFGELIFSSSRKSLLFKASLHFSLMFMLMLPLAILAGWFPLKLSEFVFHHHLYNYFIYNLDHRNETQSKRYQ
ncbi:DUF3021 domain-containing protein [Staphylococcus xylosus]|uniref:DUF3021 domain-containing protein n=1 Tax=Staphylococcus xylosus TaxID=1288 RepID=A0A939SPW9_STAXY|nr:DUF3021 domain-containing protein [Staphylococcus xylosus]